MGNKQEQNTPGAGRVTAIYFSPTRTTAKIAETVAAEMAAALGLEKAAVDLTLPASRKPLPPFGRNDLAVLGLPVYGGRIPAFLEPLLDSLAGDKTPAVAIALYGNRDYEDALLEMTDILTAKDFVPVGAGAFIGEHSLTGAVGRGRPDPADLSIAEGFAKKIAAKLQSGEKTAVSVKGNRPYKERADGAPYTPHTTEECMDCKLCARRCPMGIISLADPKIVAEGCIHCGACVKGCPAKAKYFDHPMYEKIKDMLETNCAAPKTPELFE